MHLGTVRYLEVLSLSNHPFALTKTAEKSIALNACTSSQKFLHMYKNSTPMQFSYVLGARATPAYDVMHDRTHVGEPPTPPLQPPASKERRCERVLGRHSDLQLRRRSNRR